MFCSLFGFLEIAKCNLILSHFSINLISQCKNFHHLSYKHFIIFYLIKIAKFPHMQKPDLKMLENLKAKQAGPIETQRAVRLGRKSPALSYL